MSIQVKEQQERADLIAQVSTFVNQYTDKSPEYCQEHFSTLIKIGLKLLGWTNTKAAQLFGVTDRTIKRWKSGKHRARNKNECLKIKNSLISRLQSKLKLLNSLEQHRIDKRRHYEQLCKKRSPKAKPYKEQPEPYYVKNFKSIAAGMGSFVLREHQRLIKILITRHKTVAANSGAYFRSALEDVLTIQFINIGWLSSMLGVLDWYRYYSPTYSIILKTDEPYSEVTVTEIQDWLEGRSLPDYRSRCEIEDRLLGSLETICTIIDGELEFRNKKVKDLSNKNEQLEKDVEEITEDRNNIKLVNGNLRSEMQKYQERAMRVAVLEEKIVAKDKELEELKKKVEESSSKHECKCGNEKELNRTINDLRTELETWRQVEAVNKNLQKDLRKKGTEIASRMKDCANLKVENNHLQADVHSLREEIAQRAETEKGHQPCSNCGKLAPPTHLYTWDPKTMQYGGDNLVCANCIVKFGFNKLDPEPCPACGELTVKTARRPSEYNEEGWECAVCAMARRNADLFIMPCPRCKRMVPGDLQLCHHPFDNNKFEWVCPMCNVEELTNTNRVLRGALVNKRNNNKDQRADEGISIYFNGIAVTVREDVPSETSKTVSEE